MRSASEVQQLASRIDLHQSRREIFIKLPNRFPEVLFRAVSLRRMRTMRSATCGGLRRHHAKGLGYRIQHTIALRTTARRPIRPALRRKNENALLWWLLCFAIFFRDGAGGSVCWRSSLCTRAPRHRERLTRRTTDAAGEDESRTIASRGSKRARNRNA